MTYGATESLIPEDCHLIVENTETGTTLQQNRLKIIDELMESEGCLVASGEGMEISWKKDLIAGFVRLFGNYLALLKK
jgi:ATP phosphoribosyltransferase